MRSAQEALLWAALLGCSMLMIYCVYTRKCRTSLNTWLSLGGFTLLVTSQIIMIRLNLTLGIVLASIGATFTILGLALELRQVKR